MKAWFLLFFAVLAGCTTTDRRLAQNQYGQLEWSDEERPSEDATAAARFFHGLFGGGQKYQESFRENGQNKAQEEYKERYQAADDD